MMQAYAHYESHTKSIEVLRGNNLVRVHFFDKNCKVLREDVKEQLKWEVNRNSPGDKIEDFVDRAKFVPLNVLVFSLHDRCPFRTILADNEYIQSVQDFSHVTKFVLDKYIWWSQGGSFSRSRDVNWVVGCCDHCLILL